MAKIDASIGWMVCHPLGTPCLALVRTTIMVYCNSIDSVENIKKVLHILDSQRYQIFTSLRFANL